jgi:signal-transduction protein with cAMP-binding, CBS, and nucleotidyltransferase domain
MVHASTEIHADILILTILVNFHEISGNNRLIVELTGTAQEVFEAARFVMSLLTRNTFSMGAVITVENVVIQGNGLVV